MTQITRAVDGGEVDGRRLRREQNREAVLDAMVELFEEGNLTPTTGEVAERAGLSPRSLFRYFDDIDDLNRAAIDRQLHEAGPLLDPDVMPDASLHERIDALVATRVRLWDAIAPAARAARALAHRRSIVATQLHDGRAYMRHQLEGLFPDAPAGLLPAVDALCSFESYELLRYDRRMSRAATADALTAGLHALLGGSR
jgi:AcrR family transcriptional regulator